MQKEYKIKIEMIDSIDDEIKIRYRNLINSLVLFSIKEDYRIFLVNRGFDFEYEIVNQFKIGFFENLEWLISKKIIIQNFYQDFIKFQAEVEKLLSVKWKCDDITKLKDWINVNNSASILLNKLDEKTNKFNFEGRYVIVNEKNKETFLQRIKKYFVPFILFFVFLTILSLLSKLQNTNQYDNPLYIFPLISFIGSCILFLSIIFIQEIAKPKREKKHLRKLQKTILKDMNTMLEDNFVELYHKDFLFRIQWDNWNNLNNYKSSLNINVFFNHKEVNFDSIKLTDKRLKLFENNIRFQLISGYYKLPPREKVLNNLDYLIKVIMDLGLKPISKEELELDLMIGVIMRNEYLYREEHVYA